MTCLMRRLQFYALCRNQKLEDISASHAAALQKAICVVQEVVEERKTSRLDTAKSLISRQLRNRILLFYLGKFTHTSLVCVKQGLVAVAIDLEMKQVICVTLAIVWLQHYEI